MLEGEVMASRLFSWLVPWLKDRLGKTNNAPAFGNAGVGRGDSVAEPKDQAPSLPDACEWLQEYVARHGRRPRVLHIGNLANNAYYNAKLLNRAGFDCDVLCCDTYHIMSCPEWEDADF